MLSQQATYKHSVVGSQKKCTYLIPPFKIRGSKFHYPQPKTWKKALNYSRYKRIRAFLFQTVSFI